MDVTRRVTVRAKARRSHGQQIASVQRVAPCARAANRTHARVHWIFPCNLADRDVYAGVVCSSHVSDAHRSRRIAEMLLELRQLVVQLLAHPVQALEFELLAVRERFDLPDRVRVVGGEGRVNGIARGEQFPGAGEIGNIRRHLAREHRIIGKSANLGELDLRVPVSALDEPDHQLAPVCPRRLDHPIAQRRGAFLIGLDGDPEAAPAIGECFVVAEQRFKHVHLQLEPVGLLGIDGEADAGFPREPCQRRHARHQLGHHAIRLGYLVARMEGRQLDRDAGAGDRAASRLPDFAKRAVQEF